MQALNHWQHLGYFEYDSEEGCKPKMPNSWSRMDLGPWVQWPMHLVSWEQRCYPTQSDATYV